MQFNQSPLIVTLVAGKAANTGAGWGGWGGRESFGPGVLIVWCVCVRAFVRACVRVGGAAIAGILLDVGREVCAIAQPVATALQESLSSK